MNSPCEGCARNGGRRTIAAALVLALSCAPLSAQDLERVPPRDPLPMIQLAQTVATEMGALCSKRFPDLKAPIDKAFQAWPLRSVTISVQVNGRDYENPTLAFIVSTIRQDFLAADEGESRKACADYPAFLAKVVGDIPPNVLAPFTAPAR